MHIYVHVPFCARRCSYCDFAIAVRRETPDAQFVDAILQEWRNSLEPSNAPAQQSVSTLYFGGGTPSRLEPESLARIIGAIGDARPFATDVELTLETNPDDVTAERATAWRAAGINRVSLGVQSHDATVLAWMHRTHRAEQVAPAIAMLRDAGIANVSVDLIFALPSNLRRDWRDDLERTFALAPDHVSLYGLTIEPHTPLFRWTERGTTVVSPDERYADEFVLANEMLVAAGFEHYEVSNAARPGFRSRHNSAYWSGAEYLGLGPSAHSYRRGERQWNVREWAEYQARSARQESILGGAETPDAAARALERRYLALRTSAGLAEAELPPGVRDSWRQNGWAVEQGGRIRLTVEGWLRLDALVAAASHS